MTTGSEKSGPPWTTRWPTARSGTGVEDDAVVVQLARLMARQGGGMVGDVAARLADALDESPGAAPHPSRARAAGTSATTTRH